MGANLAYDHLTALAADLRRRSAGDPALTAFADQLDRIDGTPNPAGQAQTHTHPAMAYLDPALDSAAGDPRLLTATRAITSALYWRQVFQGEGVAPDLAEGMLAGQIAGPTGIVASDTCYAGVFLLAPGIHYPLHTHASTEIYYCLSGTLSLQHGIEGMPFGIDPGDYSVTPANRIHSLTTGERPVLLLYVWIGELDTPNWWWERRPEGGWLRVNWSRAPDGSWVKTDAELATEAHLRQANG